MKSLVVVLIFWAYIQVDGKIKYNQLGREDPWYIQRTTNPMGVCERSQCGYGSYGDDQVYFCSLQYKEKANSLVIMGTLYGMKAVPGNDSLMTILTAGFVPTEKTTYIQYIEGDTIKIRKSVLKNGDDVESICCDTTKVQLDDDEWKAVEEACPEEEMKNLDNFSCGDVFING